MVRSLLLASVFIASGCASRGHEASRADPGAAVRLGASPRPPGALPPIDLVSHQKVDVATFGMG